jgi:hypothetical protein
VFDPREPFVKGLVGSGFANEKEVAARSRNVLADRLARIEIVAEIDQVELGVMSAMGFEPPACGTAFTVLLLTPVLRRHEFRWQWHDAIVTRSNEGGRK